MWAGVISTMKTCGSRARKKGQLVESRAHDTRCWLLHIVRQRDIRENEELGCISPTWKEE